MTKHAAAASQHSSHRDGESEGEECWNHPHRSSNSSASTQASGSTCAGIQALILKGGNCGKYMYIGELKQFSLILQTSLNQLMQTCRTSTAFPYVGGYMRFVHMKCEKVKDLYKI